jgi:hypothetical protein
MFMDTLQSILFENPLGIYIALAIIGALGLVSYQNWRTFKSLWPTVIALVTGAMVFTVSTLIVTNREHIGANCEKIVDAINNRNMPLVERLLDKDFDGQQRYQTRNEAVRRLTADLKAYGVTNVKYRIDDLKVQGDLATMAVRTDITSETIPAMRLNWHVSWIKRSKEWLVYTVKIKIPRLEPDESEN